MKIKLYDDAPVLDTAGDDAFIEADLLQELIQHAQVFNRPPTFGDPFREGLAGFLRYITPNNNIEADSLQALVGNSQARLNDPIGQRMSQQEWDAHMMEDAARARDNNFLGLHSMADYIQPTHHAEPETWLGEKAHNAAQAVPGILGTVAEYAALGPAGTWLLNTILGSYNAQQQVYSNLRGQGLSPDEARREAQGFLGNAADVITRGGANLATLKALGRPYLGGSPIAHVLDNIITGAAVSGAGAMSEKAIDNYRNDIDNPDSVMKAGQSSALTTVATGLALGALDWRKLRNAQTEYNARTKGIEVEGRDITPPDEPQRLGGGNTPPKTPPQSPLDGFDITSEPPSTVARLLPQGNLRLPDFGTSNASRLARYNSVIAARGLTPITNDFQPNASAREIAGLIYGGLMSQEEAISMLQEAGLTPKNAQNFIETGFLDGRFYDTPDTRGKIILDDGTVKPYFQFEVEGARKDNPLNLPNRSGFAARTAGNEAYYGNDYYSDNGGDNSAPLQDIPDDLTPDGVKIRYTPDGKKKFSRLPDDKRLIRSENGSFHDGQMEIVDSAGNTHSVIVKHVPSIGSFLFAFSDGKIRSSGFNEGTIGSYNYKLNELISPYGKHDDLDAAFEAFSQNIDKFYTPNQENSASDSLATLGTGSIDDDLKELSSTKPETPTQSVSRDNAFPDNITLKNGSFSVPELGTFNVKAIGGNSFHITGGNPDKLGSRKHDMNLVYDTKERYFMYTPSHYYDEALEAVKQAFLNNSRNFYDLGATPAQPETPKPAKPDKPRLSPITNYTSDEAKATAERNLQMLRDAEDENERIRLLGTLNKGQLLDLKQAMKHHGLGDIGGVGNSITDLKRNFLRFLKKSSPIADEQPHENISTELEKYQGSATPAERSAINKKNLAILDSCITGLPDNEQEIRSLLEGLNIPELRGITRWRGNFHGGNAKKSDYIDNIIASLKQKLRSDPRYMPFEHDDNAPTVPDKPFFLAVGGKQYMLSPINGRLQVAKFDRGAVIEEELFFINGHLHKFDVFGNSLTLRDEYKELEQAIINHLNGGNGNKTTQPTAEPKPEVPQSNNTPTIKEDFSHGKVSWHVSINGEEYYVHPYHASVPEFKEWIIEPQKPHSRSEHILYDAYLDKFTTQGYEANKHVAAVEAIRQTLTDFYREAHGPTKADKAASGKSSGNEEQPRPIRVDTASADESDTDTTNSGAENETPPQAQLNTHSTETSSSVAPHLKIAEHVKSRVLEALQDEYADIKPITTDELIQWANEAFGGTKGEGKFDPRDYYDAMELGINLAIKEAGITPGNAEDTHDAVDDIIKLIRILQVIPTQTNRTNTQVRFQQFSTPHTLAYLVNWLASIRYEDIVLEPSAGTGNLAVFAHNLGAGIILNEIADLRADLLKALDLNSDGIHREDAIHLGDILASKLSDDERPDRVIMNPPFSAAGKQGTANSNSNGFKHVEQALSLLKDNGRLVAILGAGRDGIAKSVRKWLDERIYGKFNVRAVITVDGKAYKKFGTTFSNAIVVIDKTGATPKNSSLNYSFSGDFNSYENIRNLFDTLAGLVQDFSTADEATKNNVQDTSTTDNAPDTINPGIDNQHYSVEAFHKAFDNSDKGRIFVRIAKIRHYLGWPREVFDNMVRNLRNSEVIYLNSADPTIHKGDIFDDGFLDEYGIMNATMIWNDNGYHNNEPDNNSIPPEPDTNTPSPDTANNSITDALSDNQALNAVFDYLDNDADLTLNIDRAIKASLETGFREQEQKSRQIQRSIYQTLIEAGRDKETATKQARDIFALVRDKSGYDDEHTSTTSSDDNSARPAAVSNQPKPDKNNSALVHETPEHENTIPAANQMKNNTRNPKQEHKPNDSTPEGKDAIAISPDAQKDTQPEEHSAPKSEGKNPSPSFPDDSLDDSPEPQPVSIYSDYEPQEHENIHLFSLAKPHTSKLVETTNMKNVKLPPLTYEPDLPEDIIKSGAITVSQLEAIAYDGQSFSQKIPSGQTRGFILGDGTGAGKGRTIAGIIRDQLNHNHGNGKAVWFSISAGLVNDAKRDWGNIGNNPDDFFTLGDFKVADSIPADKKGIMFSTYATFISRKKKTKNNALAQNKGTEGADEAEESIDVSRIQQVIDWLGKDFDGVIAFDECQQINNLGGKQGARGEIQASQSAVAASMLANALPNARVLYVSATAASDPSNLLMFDRSGLWGEWAPFANGQQFAQEMKNGGTNAMEMFARDAKSMGLFIARFLSNQDVTYRRVTYNLNPAERSIYDKVAEAWRLVDEARTNVPLATGADVKADRARSESDFRAMQLRSFKFFLTALKVPQVIEEAKKYLENGYSVIIQVDNTYDAQVTEATGNMKPEQDYRDIVLSPVDDLIEFVNKWIDVRAHNTVKVQRPNGDFSIQIVPAVDSNGKPVISQEALRMKNTLLAHLRQIKFNMSPLDEIINSLGGPEHVAEITGRKHRLIRMPDGSVKDLGAPPSPKSEMDAFNNWTEPKKVTRKKGEDTYTITEGGKKRVLLFSGGKGGTGYSYHADRSFKNQQRRAHIVLDVGFGATKAMQGLGRGNRSNQVSAPEYVVISTDVPGEIRLISSIARKLEQMGTLTAGERKSTTQGIFSEKDNLDSKLAKNAMNNVLQNIADNAYGEFDNGPGILMQMGLIKEREDGAEELKDVKIATVFNRLLSLNLDNQEKLMSLFRLEHEMRLAVSIQNGQGDVGTEFIRAQSVKVLQEHTLLEDKQKGLHTKLLELDVAVRTRTRPFSNVRDTHHCTEFFTDQFGEIYAAKKNGEYDDKGNLIRGSFDVKGGKSIQRYTLFSPDFSYSYATNADGLMNRTNSYFRFTPVQPEKAQSLWDDRIKSLDNFHSDKMFLISGVMLPIWHNLKNLKSRRILRITDKKGNSFLGRLVGKDEVPELIRRFNLAYKQHRYSAQDVIDRIKKPRSFARLDNDWKIKFSSVNGEKRIEIFNVGLYGYYALSTIGVLQEIIGSEYRYFIPVGRNDILDALLEKHPAFDFDDDLSADDIMDEAVTLINSNIPDEVKKNYIIHPSFWGFGANPAEASENPYVHESPYAMSTPEREKRYTNAKDADSSKSLWQHLKDFGSQVWRGRHDLPELAGDDRLIPAQEWIRQLKRERQANVHETIKRLRAALLGLTPDDFDLFQRAMELQDLYETRNSDPTASMPWGLNPTPYEISSGKDPVREEFARIMEHVRKNKRVQEAMKKADILMEDLRDKLIEAAERLSMFDVRDRLRRKHYFRHLVLEYYNAQREGKPHPTFKNPQRRGYMKHREGSSKDISSNWILAMGEVFTRMNDDIKILDTLFKLRKKYDIIEDLKQQAWQANMAHALDTLMKDLKDVPEELRKTKAQETLSKKLLARQSRAMSRLFKLAANGDLPAGDNNEWLELAGRMADAGQLEKLSREEQQKLASYIGWLAGLPERSKARKYARNFLSGKKDKMSRLKRILGNDYVDWKDLIPDNHTLWSPSDSRLVFSASTVPEYMLKIAMENIDELLGVELSDLGRAVASGGDKQLWCIPEKLADALDNLGKSQPVGTFGRIMNSMMGAFKRWVTIGPQEGRFFKYNWRNFFGDLEAVLQGNPDALRYLRQATKELTDTMLKGGVATGLLAEFEKRGGGLTSEFMTELEKPDRLKQFAHLFEHEKEHSPVKFTLSAFRAYIDIASTLTSFRESILRYASFLSYVKLIQDNGGVPPYYGMSKPKEVLALSDNIYDMAFKLANENLGAYDQLSQNMQWLKDNNFLSFASWIEVNFKRFIRSNINIWQGNSYLEYWLRKHGQEFIDKLAGNGGGGGKEPPKPPKGNNGGDFADDGDNPFRRMFRRIAKKSGLGAMRLALTLALAASLWFITSIFNWLNGENNEKLPPDVRNKPHLTLGTNPFTGEVMYLGEIGSAFDFFQTIGVGKLIAGDLRDLFNGTATFGEVISNIIDGPVSKFANNANPYAKALIEAAFGKRMFPSALHPTPILDKGRFIAQSFGLDWYYDWLTDKPHKPFLNLADSVVNTANPEQSAYFYILSRKKQFEENVLGKSTDAFTQTRRGEALRNAKRAADLGDRKTMRKYLREFYRAGGTNEGLKASARAADPLYGLNKEDKMRFMRWLPKDERKILKRAIRYSERLKARLGVW